MGQGLDQSFDAPVLIAGGGPVGLCLALELSWRGIRSILVEREDGVPRHPKVGHISVRTMEHIRRWGLVDQLRNCGFPPDYVLRMVYCTSMNGYRLCAHEYPNMREAVTSSVTPEKKQRCPQLWFDPILARAIQEYPLCDIRYHTTLSSFTQDNDGVSAVLVGPSGSQTIRASYLAACDGANSELRKQLGIPMQGLDNLSRSVAIYFRSPVLLGQTNQGEAERYTFIGSDGTWGNLTVVDGNELWRLTIFGSHDKVDLNTFDAAGWIRRCLANDQITFEILSVLPWRRAQLVAERFMLGRTFLVGDAAHTMSPTGGFGMNTGIGDAVDLGWKLEATLRGWGTSGLLASYDAERRPIGARNAQFSAANFHNLVGIKDLEAILDDSERGIAVRDRVGLEMESATRAEYESLGVILGYRYDPSPICIEDGTPEIPDLPDVYTPTARPGSRAPHVWLGANRSTLDFFGRSFVLLCFGQAETDRFVRAAGCRRMPLEVITVDNEEAATLYEFAFVLVRPDGHVSWRANNLPDDCLSLVDRVRGG